MSHSLRPCPTLEVVREVRFRLRRRGFRDQTMIVVTKLLDVKRYSAEQLKLLYGWRWEAESSQFAPS